MSLLLVNVSVLYLQLCSLIHRSGSHISLLRSLAALIGASRNMAIGCGTLRLASPGNDLAAAVHRRVLAREISHVDARGAAAPGRPATLLLPGRRLLLATIVLRLLLARGSGLPFRPILTHLHQASRRRVIRTIVLDGTH